MCRVSTNSAITRSTRVAWHGHEQPSPEPPAMLRPAPLQRAFEPPVEAAEHQRSHVFHRSVGDARAAGEVGEWSERHARTAARRQRDLPATVHGRPLDDADMEHTAGIALDPLRELDPTPAHDLMDLTKARPRLYRPV